LALLVAGEAAIARTSKVVALDAIAMIAGCDIGYAGYEDGRGRHEGKKECAHFALLRCGAPLDPRIKRAASV
jgi:hypothetical protein